MIRKEERKIIGQNLKKIMRMKKITEAQLSQITDLSTYQISNIVHARACPEDTLKKVSDALRIPIERLMQTNVLEKRTHEFNIKLYNKLSSYVSEFVEKKSLTISKEQMDRVIYAVYKNINTFKDPQNAINTIMIYLYEQGEFQEIFDK